MRLTVMIRAAPKALNFSRMLLWPAIRSRLRRDTWRAEFNAQPGWGEAFARGRFSSDFTVEHGHYWWGTFKDRRENIRDYLELGSWEGQSAVLAAWLFPQSAITAVDWFANQEANAAFDLNTRPFADRLEKIPGTTWEVLHRLAANGRRFDLIYIDADHRFDAVLMDTILSWPLLRKGGFLVWDDYVWSHPAVQTRFNPKPAIDAWLATRSPQIEVMFAATQVCVRKLAEDPEVQDMSGQLAWNGSPVTIAPEAGQAAGQGLRERARPGGAHP